MAIRKIETYKQVCEVIGMDYNDVAKMFFSEMERFGHTEKSICYATYRSKISLRNLVSSYKYWKDKDISAEVNFLCAWQDKIEEFSWKQDDLRWKEHDKRKEEELKIDALKLQLDNQHAKQTEVNNRTGYIYFIQGECGGAIKIGYSYDPKKRLKELQTGYPDTLTILAMITGNEKVEKELHKEFDSCRLKGEWFRPDNCLINKIKRLKAI